MKVSRFVSVLIVGAFVLSACGGGDDTDTASPATTSGATSGGSGDTGGAVAGGAFDAAQCAQVVSAMSAAAAAIPQAMSGGAGDLSTSLAQLKAFAAAAPEEIRDDLTLVYTAYGEFVSAMQAAGYDPSGSQPPSAEAIAAMQTATKAFQDPDFVAASEHVQTWFTSNCGS
jgi:hypothetical protein